MNRPSGRCDFLFLYYVQVHIIRPCIKYTIFLILKTRTIKYLKGRQPAGDYLEQQPRAEVQRDQLNRPVHHPEPAPAYFRLRQRRDLVLDEVHANAEQLRLRMLVPVHRAHVEPEQVPVGVVERSPQRTDVPVGERPLVRREVR